MQYINGYICRCLALFFISGCIRLPEYHILQFHTFLIYGLPEEGTNQGKIEMTWKTLWKDSKRLSEIFQKFLKLILSQLGWKYADTLNVGLRKYAAEL